MSRDLQFSESSEEVLARSLVQAAYLKHNYLGTEHLLLGLTEQTDPISSILRDLGVTEDGVRNSLEDIIGIGVDEPAPQVPLTPRLRKVLALAVKDARRHGQNEAWPVHLFRAILKFGDGVAYNILGRLGVTDSRDALARTTPLLTA